MNIPVAESPGLGSGGGISSFVANPNFSSSTLSLAVSQPLQPPKPSNQTRSKSTILSRSLIQGGPSFRPGRPSSIKEDIRDPDSSYATAADQTRAPHDDDFDGNESNEGDHDSAEVEDALDVGDDEEGPSERELELQRKNELLHKQLEQVKLLVLGLDKRLQDREEVLAKTIERAVQENRGLDAKLRELDLNKA